MQIGPLRVRYLRDCAATPGAPSLPDADGTRVIRGPQPLAEAASPTPLPASLDAFRAPASAEAEVDDMEGETRVGSAGVFAEAVKGAMVAGGDAAGFTPTPRPAPMPPVIAPTPAEPPAVHSRTSHPPAFASFVLIQLGALAIIVFVSTVAPLIVSRGTVLTAIDEGSVTALLVWPILPLVIGLAATLVIANIVTRRVLDALGAGRQSAEGR